MFYGRQIMYNYYRPTITKDQFKYPKVEYGEEPTGQVKIFITTQDRSLIFANDLELIKATFVGYTDEDKLQEGDKIEDDYIVETVLPSRRGFIVYMKEFEDGIV